ncbi:MAG: protein-disulfide reductase DsbD N-terminal domain-containing protein [Proteobacteria bacterium]|nr:protein-disulfide reductase DsbD N-terminal domain-containing protein [Pseudomonadota bacterium]
MTRFQRIIAALLLVLPAGGLLAAGERPLPPQEVFHYAVADTGGALEIDWAVNDGAYMYRDAFSFTVDDPSIVLGSPELPEGKVHTDEFLGEQVIYRDNFFVRIPYTVQGSAPATVELVIESRGCLDEGFCYLPQSWTETVKLRAPTSDKQQLSFGSLGGNSMDQAQTLSQQIKQVHHTHTHTHAHTHNRLYT